MHPATPTSPHPRRSLRSGALAVLLAASVMPGLAAAQDVINFSPGALIIPMQASYQDACGSISGYGLVWRILQSNQAGRPNATHPVTVYWMISPSKGSPNRCVPSNLTKNAQGGAWNANSKWNDGCDITITSTDVNMPPIVPVDYTSPLPAGGLYPKKSFSLKNYGSNTTFASPNLAVTAFNTATPNLFQTAQFGGGPFVIDAADAPYVIDLIRTDPALAVFKNKGACGSVCTAPSKTCHYVEMYQNTAPFLATVGKRMSSVPPKIALLDTGAGVKYCGAIPGDKCDAGVERVLDTYLANAGLYVGGTNGNDSGGCPTGTLSGCNINASKSGFIYDRFDSYSDLISTATFPEGLINATDSATGKLRYRVFWTPHWETWNPNDWSTGNDISQWSSVKNDVQYSYYLKNPTDPAGTTQRQSALNNVSRFLDKKGTGLMAECASTAAYEGAKYKDFDQPTLSTKTNYMYTGKMQANKITDGVTLSWDGRNCTDPNYSSDECIYYANVSVPFAQVGDYHFTGVTGTINLLGHATSGTTYGNIRPYVTRMGISWKDYTAAATPLTATPTGNNGWDLFNLAQKDNDPEKGTIIYIAGHEYTGSTAGNRIVLNTLLNLGYDPISKERSLNAPVAFLDPNGTASAGTSAIKLSAHYMAVTGYPADPALKTFTFANGSHWVFPMTPGRFRAHPLVGPSAVTAGETNFDDAVLWSAEDVLGARLPNTRNLFTYLGGKVVDSTAAGSPLLPGNVITNKVIQTGWQPEKINYDRILPISGAPISSGCVDVMTLGKTPDNKFGLVASGGDGICDLQQALNFTPMIGGVDFGLLERVLNVTALTTDIPKVKAMLQVYRGYCFATPAKLDGPLAVPNFEPSSATLCNRDTADNKAHLGGFIHSTPAVSQPSPNIPDAGGFKRPTVAFAGSKDGQLHAFYVSGGSKYTGPSATLHYPPNSVSADSMFPTNYASQFAAGTLPPMGTELWSFVPAGQLPFIQYNDAMVDSSPVILDAFVDLNGSGIREWHTILVSGAGEKSREVFALDITNPLKPRMLWHIMGSIQELSPGYPAINPTALSNGVNLPGSYLQSPRWNNPDQALTYTHFFDYSELGNASAVSAAQIRAGVQPVYAAFVASSSGITGTQGIKVFSIDLATGQKLWSWSQPYTAGRGAPNEVPAMPTLLLDDSGVQSVFVGDLEGRVWELDPNRGSNVNYYSGVSYAAFDTEGTNSERRPITTNIGYAQVPAAPAAGSLFENYKLARILVFGTGGANWVNAATAGKFYSVLVDTQYRRQIRADGSTGTSARLQASTKGVLQGPTGTGFPISYAGPEHLYGQITIVGQMVIFSTAKGPVGDDLMLVDGKTGGSTYSINLGTANPTTPANKFPQFTLANYGGIAAISIPGSGGASTEYLITDEVSKQGLIAAGTSSTTASSPYKATPSGPLFQLKTWMNRMMGCAPGTAGCTP